MNIVNQEINLKRKKLIIKISAVFLGVLVLLTFFSNTINNFSLPRVKVETPSSGALNKDIIAEGIVEEKETVKDYAQSGRKVLEVYVKAGSNVKKGSPIMMLDKEGLQEQLDQELLLLEKAKLSLEKLADSSEEDNLSSLKRSIKTAENKMLAAQKNLEETKSLYDIGAEAKASLDKVQEEYDSAREEYGYKQEDYSLALKNQSKKTEDKKRDIKDRQLDVKLQELKVNKISKELSADSMIISPCDGIVKEIGFDKGSVTNTSTALYSIIDTSKGFQFRAPVDKESIKPVKLDDKVEVTFETAEDRIIEGKVLEIKNSLDGTGDKKDIIVVIPQEGVKGEEKGKMRVAVASKNYEFLVPNSAVGENEKGKFVYVLKEKKGPLGNEYFIQQAVVTVDDYDNFRSAVLSGLEANEKIVVSSSKETLYDGCRVMLER
ncbi:MAG: transporter [Eubacterium sp.]|nr:transporter [Eubacterium sp.]